MTQQLCPRGCGNPARTNSLYGVLPCLSCIAEDRKTRTITNSPEFYTITMQSRVQEQRDRHEKEMLPPYDTNGKPNEEFARAYPEKAKELFGEYEKQTGNTTELSK